MIQYDWRTCPNPAVPATMPDYGPLASDIGPRAVFDQGPAYGSGGPSITSPCAPDFLTLGLAFIAGVFIAGRKKKR